MLWDDFLKKALNDDYVRKNGNAFIDLKSVDKLGSANEIIIAMNQAGMSDIKTYFIERVIAEKVPMEIGTIFDMWYLIKSSHRNVGMCDSLLIAYDVDVTEYSKFLVMEYKEGKLYHYDSNYRYINDNYWKHYYQKINGTLDGYFKGWKLEPIIIVDDKQIDDSRIAPKSNNNNTAQAIALPLLEVKSQEKTQPLITEMSNPKSEKEKIINEDVNRINKKIKGNSSSILFWVLLPILLPLIKQIFDLDIHADTSSVLWTFSVLFGLIAVLICAIMIFSLRGDRKKVLDYLHNDVFNIPIKYKNLHWYHQHRHPLTDDEIEKLSNQRRDERIRNLYTFTAKYADVDPAFKSSMNPKGKLYSVDLPLYNFPAYVSLLLKGKKHEWIVVAIADDSRVKYFWANKGGDKYGVSLTRSFSSLVTLCEDHKCNLLIQLHNHPNDSPQYQTCLIPSDQDIRNAMTQAKFANKNKINYLDFVCERGDYIKFYESFSIDFMPISNFVKAINCKNAVSENDNYLLHKELHGR